MKNILVSAANLLTLHCDRTCPSKDEHGDAALADVMHSGAQSLRAALDVDQHRGRSAGNLSEPRGGRQGVHLMGGCHDAQIGRLLAGKGGDEGRVVGAQIHKKMRHAGRLEGVEDGSRASDALWGGHGESEDKG